MINLAEGPSRPIKPRSQSASEGFAARGGLGPISPQGPPLSSQPTLENPSRLVVPMSPGATIKIEVPSKAPSFVEKIEPQNSNNSSGTGAEPAPPPKKSQHTMGWLTLLWNRRRSQTAHEQEVC